ncbi:MAG: tetratricopeptide repeat protein [Nitrospirae bacterium]|nr:tetratricopeptide repeat protein [Nitrospirota bacterium]
MKEIRKKAPKSQAVEEPASVKAVSDRLRGLIGPPGSGEGAAKGMPLIVYAVAAGLLLVVLAAVGWWLYQRQDLQALRLEEKGLQSLARADAGSTEAAKEAAGAFERIVGGYSWTGSAERAAYYLAGLKARTGEADKAVELYQGIIRKSGGKGDIAPLAQLGLGYVLVSKGRMEEAAAAFESAGKDPRGIPDMALFEAARIRQGRGEREKALEGYKKIEAEYPQSAMIQAARQRIAALGGPIAETKEKKPAAPAEKN